MRGSGIGRFLSAAVLFGFALGLVLVPQRAASRSPQDANAPPSATDGPVPAYHALQNAYAIAAKIKKTLYQQPCYCHCDRSQGHGSLLDCFASKHGAGCNICINEDFYSYEQSRKGKTAAQIRAGIIKGDWQSVDLTKYQQPLPAK